MALNADFQKKVNKILRDIDPEVLSYDEDEYWMYQNAYEYVEFFVTQKKLLNSAVALQLARGLHDGDHRKSALIRGDRSYRMPYVIHPLMVCKMLIELRIPMSNEELDILLASALCHDMIEDIPFLDHGRELMIQYHLKKQVYENVLAVSKEKDFTEEQTREHFQKIAENKCALLIKLSDRGNNVEDLYNRSAGKVREYVRETEEYILPLCEYGISHYPELIQPIRILEDKLKCLTDAAAVLVDRYEEQERALRIHVEQLRAENEVLRKEWKKLWKM